MIHEGEGHWPIKIARTHFSDPYPLVALIIVHLGFDIGPGESDREGEQEVVLFSKIDEAHARGSR